MKPVQIAFVLSLAIAMAGCTTSNLESAAPQGAVATQPAAVAAPVNTQVNDPFMLEVVGQCRIKVANDNGVKTDDVAVGTMTPSADGKSQFIEATVKGTKKFRCNYDGIGNFQGTAPAA